MTLSIFILDCQTEVTRNCKNSLQCFRRTCKDLHEGVKWMIRMYKYYTQYGTILSGSISTWLLFNYSFRYSSRDNMIQNNLVGIPRIQYSNDYQESSFQSRNSCRDYHPGEKRTFYIICLNFKHLFQEDHHILLTMRQSVDFIYQVFS